MYGPHTGLAISFSVRRAIVYTIKKGCIRTTSPTCRCGTWCSGHFTIHVSHSFVVGLDRNRNIDWRRCCGESTSLVLLLEGRYEQDGNYSVARGIPTNDRGCSWAFG